MKNPEVNIYSPFDPNRIEAQFNLIGQCLDEGWSMPRVERYQADKFFYYAINHRQHLVQIVPGCVVIIDRNTRIATKLIRNGLATYHQLDSQYDPQKASPLTGIIESSTRLETVGIIPSTVLNALSQICRYLAFYEKLRKSHKKARNIKSNINGGYILSDLPKRCINSKFFAGQEQYWHEMYNQLTDNTK